MKNYILISPANSTVVEVWERETDWCVWVFIHLSEYWGCFLSLFTRPQAHTHTYAQHIYSVTRPACQHIFETHDPFFTTQRKKRRWLSSHFHTPIFWYWSTQITSHRVAAWGHEWRVESTMDTRSDSERSNPLMFTNKLFSSWKNERERLPVSYSPQSFELTHSHWSSTIYSPINSSHWYSGIFSFDLNLIKIKSKWVRYCNYICVCVFVVESRKWYWKLYIIDCSFHR